MNGSVVIKGGKLLDISNGFDLVDQDIYIENGIIKNIENKINKKNCKVLHLNEQIVTPGFIDIHTHVYPGKAYVGIKPEKIGIKTGTTTLIDAGSVGAKHFNHFYETVIKKSNEEIFSLINVAYMGLTNGKYELADLDNIDLNLLEKVIKKNYDKIIGIKARASASTVGKLGIKPIKLAKKVSKKMNIPLMVHIGNNPPKIEKILPLLDENDVITHSFHGKKNGILSNKGRLKKEVIRAKERGVLFDVGHGSSSFNFNVAQKAINQGFYPDTISTDIYSDNYQGPVYNLITTVNKIISLGVNFKDCINMVTNIPAVNFNLDFIGNLKKGYQGDLTIFNLKSTEVNYKDSDGNTITNNKVIEGTHVVKKGKIYELD